MTKIRSIRPGHVLQHGRLRSRCGSAIGDLRRRCEWLEAAGRTSRAHQPRAATAAFAQQRHDPAVLEAPGETALPRLWWMARSGRGGRYPSRDNSQNGLTSPSEMSLFTDEVAELVALGAAVASNCEPCFKFHFDQARKLGVTDADMRRAVELARRVKETPARGVLDLAHRYLNKQTTSTTISVTAASTAKSEGGCCGPTSGKVPAASAKCC